MSQADNYDKWSVKEALERYLAKGVSKKRLLEELRDLYSDFQAYHLTNILKPCKPSNKDVADAVLSIISKFPAPLSEDQVHFDFHEFFLKEITSAECYGTAFRYVGNYLLYRHAINHDMIVVTLLKIYKQERENRVYYTQIKKKQVDVDFNNSPELPRENVSINHDLYISHGIVYSFSDNIYLIGAVKKASEFFVLSQDNSVEISHLFGVTLLEAPSNLKIGSSRVYLKRISDEVGSVVSVQNSSIGLYPPSDPFVSSIYRNYLNDDRDQNYRVIGRK